MTENGWTSTVEAQDQFAYAYLTSDSGDYSRSYLILDWGEREARIEWRHQSQTGCMLYEWHGHQSALCLPPNVDARRLVAWLDGHAAQLTQITDGYESAWDGHNHVAQFSSEAAEALNGLIDEAATEDWNESLALPDGQGVWDAGQWLYDARHELVTATTTDAEITATTERMEAEALAEGVRLEGTEEYLRSVRDDLLDSQ